MYVVYDETTTPDGVTERLLLWTAPSFQAAPYASGRRRAREAIEHPARSWRTLKAAEDAFCLPDGSLLIFRP